MLWGGSLVKFGIIAALIHECGHILIYYYQRKKFPTITFGFADIAIKQPQLQRFAYAVLLCGGIAANIITTVICLIINELNARYFLQFLASANLIIAAFNIIPLQFSDGGRLLLLFIPVRLLHIADLLFAICSAILAATMLFFAVNTDQITLQIFFFAVIIIIIFKIFDRN